MNSQGAEMKWELRSASGKKQEEVFGRVDLPLLKCFPFVLINEILNIHQTQDINKIGSHIRLDFSKNQLIQLLICLSLPSPLSFFSSAQ